MAAPLSSSARALWIDRPDGRLGAAVAKRSDATITTHLGGAEVVVLAGVFAEDDAEAICEKAENTGFSGPCVLISSLAERAPERWLLPEPDHWRDEPLPPDDYGRAKRRARELLQARWPGPTVALLLPALIHDGRRLRWAQLADVARETGIAPIAGTGRQRTAAVTVGDVARLVVALTGIVAGWPTTLQVSTPNPPEVGELAQAFLAGAGIQAQLQRHTDPDWRYPFSGAEERCNAGRMHALLPDLRWDDPVAACTAIGRAMASPRRTSS